jgi:uncharacterized protein YcbX
LADAGVSALFVYPVKSLRAVALAAAAVEPCGLAEDRRWMVVDAAGRFMTQREHPRMALLAARVDGGGLVLSAAGRDSVAVAGAGAPGGAACRVRRVQVWRDSVAAADCGDAAADWLAAALGVPCRLVRLADPAARPLPPAYARAEREVVSFADGFPLLLACEASLAEVNGRLDRPVPMLRFRPNLVVSGAEAWAEDCWRRIRIGEAVFRVAKPCDRCVMVTLDPQTGAQPDGNEPLRTLSLFRRNLSGRVMFGQNLVPERCGVVRVGDRVEVLEAGDSNVFFGA